ncbi:MAG: hypothetical protein MUE41_18505 [Gemmatimonadaceae bacterium]|nr:hypothetical protein [Gemmatimonadaceae bacterium]
MVSWLAALVVGALASWIGYPARPDRASWLAAACRGVAALLLAALLFDAPAARSAARTPLVALDASASMGRGGAALWRTALDSARASGGGRRLALVGDSVRLTADPDTAPPARGTLALGALVESALQDGVPVTFVTDGELAAGVGDVLGQLPAGSRTVVVPRPAMPDVAVARLDVEEPMLAGDTAHVRVELRSDAGAVPDVRLRVRVGDASPIERALGAFPAWEARTLDVAVPLGAASGEVDVVARVVATGDVHALCARCVARCAG